MKDDTIGGGQLLVCVYLTMTAEMLIRPYRDPIQFPAQVLIPAAGVNLLLVALLLRPQKRSVLCCAQRAQNPVGKIILFFAAAVLSVSGGAALNDADGFLGFTGEERISFFLFLPLVLLLVFYAVRLGAEGFARVGGVVLILILLSFGLVVLSNLRDLRLQNLQILPHPETKVLQALGTGFYFSPALLAGTVLSEKTQYPTKLRWSRLLIGVFATYFLFTVIGELTLGSFASVQRQPVYTLARIGGLSVFRRLDSLHSSIWLMALLLGIVMEAAATELLLRGIMPKRGKRYTVLVTVLLFGSTAVLLHLFPTATLFRWITVGAAGGTLLLAIILQRRRREH